MGAPGIAPVISLPDAGAGEAAAAGVACGISTLTVDSDVAGANLLSDWRPSGAGEVMDGAGADCSTPGGLALVSAGVSVERCSLDFSVVGMNGKLPPSSR